MPLVVPFAPSQIYQQNGRLVDLLRLQVEQTAEGQRRAGEIQAQMWGNLGQSISQGVGNVIRAQQEAPINALNKAKVQDAQDLRAGQQQLDTLLQPQTPQGPAEGGGNLPPTHPYLDANGLYDIPKLTSALASSGVSHLAPELLKGAESINASVEKHQQTQQALGQASTLLYGDMADGVTKMVKAGIPIDQALDMAAAPGLATQRFDPQQFAQMKTKLLSLPPEQQQAALGNLMDAASKVSGNKTLGKDAQELDRYGRVVASNVVAEKPTEASLAADLSSPDAAVRDRAKKALDALKPPPAPTEASLDAAAQALLAKKAAGGTLTTEEAANLKGYQDRKRTVSDPAMLAALDRQERTIAAQVASQNHGQQFQEQQAGRKELTEKVEQPYQTAQSSAQTLRDTVALAKNGNMSAAALQNLETTMAAIRAQGLNRINTAEIGVSANAGSLWDNIVSRVGKLAAGQPMDAALQKDMQQFASMLEKAAYKKYQAGQSSLVKRYNLTDESPLAGPMIYVRDKAGVLHTAPYGTPIPPGATEE